jgi:hypothetical protein
LNSLRKHHLALSILLSLAAVAVLLNTALVAVLEDTDATSQAKVLVVGLPLNLHYLRALAFRTF